MGQKFSKTRMASNLSSKITRDTCETKTGSTNSFEEKVKNNLNNLKDCFDCLEGKTPRNVHYFEYQIYHCMMYFY